MGSQKVQLYFFISLFLGIVALAFSIFFPYLGLLTVAATFAVVFYPLYKKIQPLTLHNQSIASLITMIIILCIVLIPLSFFGTLAVQQARTLYTHLSPGGVDGITATLELIESSITSFFPKFDLNIGEYIREALNWIIQNFGNVFTSVVQIILGFLLGLVALFYFLRDGEKLMRILAALSPLPDASDEFIFSHLGKAINSVIKGSLVIALIQGILTGLGFALFQVPNPALWGSIASIAALIPGIGTSLVLIPGILYLLLDFKIGLGLGLLAWGLIAVGLIDNVLGPALIGRGTKIHPFLVLFGVLGGIQLFGPAGFIAGPLILSLLFALAEIYSNSQAIRVVRETDSF